MPYWFSPTPLSRFEEALVTANVPPKVAQMLARHSTITLTMERYTHLEMVDLVDGLKRLPTMPKGNSEAGKSDVA